MGCFESVPYRQWSEETPPQEDVQFSTVLPGDGSSTAVSIPDSRRELDADPDKRAGGARSLGCGDSEFASALSTPQQHQQQQHQQGRLQQQQHQQGRLQQQQHGPAACSPVSPQGLFYAAALSQIRKAMVDTVNGAESQTLANGDSYTGELEAGTRTGKGRMVYANGDVYEGQWAADKRHGKGKFTNANSLDEYDGHWHKDARHGEGAVWTFPRCGKRFIGPFEDNQPIEEVGVWEDFSEGVVADKRKYSSVRDAACHHEQNPTHRPTMEDEAIIEDKFAGSDTQGYFGVYDGHGGRSAVEFVLEHLHKNLVTELGKGAANVEDCLTAAYLTTDTGLGQKDENKFTGSTSVSALVRVEADGKKWLYTANAGDARVVLCRDWRGVRMSEDHKVDNVAESNRIKEAGGLVFRNRVNGTLAVTRALGDTFMKDHVIGRPYIAKQELKPYDYALVLACDGLWDVCTDQHACNLLKGETSTEAMAKRLVDYAIKEGSRDNITSLVVLL